MSAEQQGKAKAYDFRRVHRLGIHPIGDLVTLLEQTTGYDVAILNATPDEHGLSMRDPERDVVCLAVARTRNPMRQRSTLAHELGHVLFADWNSTQELESRPSAEIRADAFARHLLLPEDGLEDLIGDQRTVSENELSMVVQRFRVSPAIAAIVFHSCGYIDETVKKEWMNISTPQLATRFGWADHYQILQDDSDRTRAPQRLLARAVRGYEEGVVNLQTIATLRGITTAEAHDELVAAQIFPTEHAIPSVDAADLSPGSVDLSILDDNIVNDTAP